MLSLKKKQLLYHLIVPKSIESENNKPEALIYSDPILHLFNYKEIILDSKISRIKKIELFYLIKHKIHENLFQDEIIINIKSDVNSKNYVYCYYLSLLINDNRDIVNYIYDLEYIKDIFKLMENSNNNLKKILFSKIICDIIYNYEGIDYMEEENEELKKMKIICENNINNFNISVLKPVIKDIKNKNIDEIYINIIRCLLIENKIIDYQYICDILTEMELESINITNKMIKKISTFFNNNIERLKDYEIFGINDLLNEQKINFYYLLFKYVFKTQIYIKEIRFLFNNKKRILSFIKSKNDILFKINEQNLRQKIEFLLNFFLDLDYYKQFTTKQKTESSIFIYDENSEVNNPLFNNLGEEEWVQILNDSTFTLKIANKSTCEYRKIIYGNNNVKINYDYFKKILENDKYMKQKYFIDFTKFAKFLEELKTIFIRTFNYHPNFSLIIKLKFETTFYSGNINIQCNYILPFLEKNRPKIITEYNILYLQTYNSFNTLIREINSYINNKQIIYNNEDVDELCYQEINNANKKIFENFNEYLDYLDKINNE